MKAENQKGYIVWGSKYCKEQGVEVHYEEMQGQHEWVVWDTMIDRFIGWALSQ